MLSESLEQGSKIASRELPVKRARRSLVVLLEAQQGTVEVVERGEVGGREQLALNDREVNLDLVEPAGMNGSVHEDDVAPLLADAIHGTLSAVRGAVISDPEDAPRRTIGFLGHDLVEQSAKRRDAGGGFAAPEILAR